MFIRRLIVVIMAACMLLSSVGCAVSYRPRMAMSDVHVSGHVSTRHGGVAVGGGGGGGGNLRYHDDAGDCCLDALRGFILFAIIVDLFSR